MDMTQQQTGRSRTAGARLVVVGGGMVAAASWTPSGHATRPGSGPSLLCEEPRAPYDRVALTSYFTGRDPEDLALGRRSGTTRWSRSGAASPSRPSTATARP